MYGIGTERKAWQLRCWHIDSRWEMLFTFWPRGGMSGAAPDLVFDISKWLFTCNMEKKKERKKQ